MLWITCSPWLKFLKLFCDTPERTQFVCCIFRAPSEKLMNYASLAYAFKICLALLCWQCALCSVVSADVSTLHHTSAPLLHTFVEVKAYGDNQTAAMLDLVFNEMERVNALLNNYDPASDISLINASAGKGPVVIHSETFDALSVAVHYADISKGAFDFTVAPLIELWGFSRDQPGLSGPEPEDLMIAQTRRLVDYRALGLKRDSSGTHAWLDRTGMRIDVGAFAKGFVADAAINFMRVRNVTHALVAAGGTICALGSKPDGQPWQIGIRHPRNDSTFLTVIPLQNQSVSTSGDYEKFYVKGGKRRTHIVDPRTGMPVSTVQSVTVIATNGSASDALSTALFVLGPKSGLDLIEQLSGFEALIVSASGDVLYSSGWPQKIITY